jgi:hypothetical protein
MRTAAVRSASFEGHVCHKSVRKMVYRQVRVSRTIVEQ